MSKIKDIGYFVNKAISNFQTELKQYEPDWDLPYILFGSLALLVNDQIRANKQDCTVLVKAIELIEEMASIDDGEVNDLLMVGFLEVFADEKKSIDYARVYMSAKINEYLEKILQSWGRS